MAIEDTMRKTGLNAVDALIQWSTVGMPSMLADTVASALRGIARTGECGGEDADWVLFGEVMDEVPGMPPRTRVRRTSMLMRDDGLIDHGWATFELLCTVKHCKVDLSPGMWVGLLVPPRCRQEGACVLLDESAIVWNIPIYTSSLAWQVSHLFCGAYEGWLRAMWWLQNANLGFAFASHVSVDWCPEVMKTWSYNHKLDVIRCPIHADFDPTETYVGVLADINDVTALRATSNKSNLLMTLSPPCPSWSRGGKNSGLASDEGFCFLDAILHVARVRPILALFECSDGLEAHPHWRVLSAAMQLAGYKRLWSQDVAMHQVTGNHRTRWLAVWCRQDVQGHKSDERLLCALHSRIPWNDNKHVFALPQQLVSDLTLDASQLQVYGNKALLPPAKKARAIDGASCHQILLLRTLQKGEYLPTLCASYSAQHHLQAEHAQAKGIFATLMQVNDEFRFIDPFLFASLFGTTNTLALPMNMRSAFHQLGNAISQLHALVAVLFALEGVSGEPIPKLALVAQCWEERLTTGNAIVRFVDDMYVLQPIADVVGKAIPSVITWQPWLAGSTLVRFCDDLTLLPLTKNEESQVRIDLLHALELAPQHVNLIELSCDGHDLSKDVTWNQLPVGGITLKCGSFVICTLNVQRVGTNAGDDPIVSPTQQWWDTGDDPDFDCLVDAQRSGLLHAMEYVCQDDQPRTTVRVLLLQQDGTFNWIQHANSERLGSIPSFNLEDQCMHFVKVNQEACRSLLGVQVVMAIHGPYEPVSELKWILLAGGRDVKWLKICRIKRTLTPAQCSAHLEQECTSQMRNAIECRADQPLMLINGDVLWCDARPAGTAPVYLGGMDHLANDPGCNVYDDQVVARLLQFNFEPGALAIDEMVFHCDMLQLLMPSICWCPPAVWVNNATQFRFPVEPADLQLCYQHFVVPILVLFDWIFVEVRFFDGQWRVVYHSPEQLSQRQRTAVLELINVMRIQVFPNAFRWVRTTEDSDLSAWHTVRTFYARAGAPLLPTTHRTTQRLQRSQYSDHVNQIIDQADFVWREINTDDRMLQFARASRNAFLVAIMESPSRASDLALRATGRPPQGYNIHEIFFVSEEWLDLRANIYRTHPGWATSDEIEFFLSYFLPESFCPPVLHIDLSLIAPGVKPRCDQVQRFVALREGHWVGIEVVCNVTEQTCRVVILQAPATAQHYWTNFAEEYIVPLGFRPIIIVDTTRTRPGMCGWELLHRWVVGDFSLPEDFHIPLQKRHLVDLILEESNRAWRIAGAPPLLRTFAENLRRAFLPITPTMLSSLPWWYGRAGSRWCCFAGS